MADWMVLEDFSGNIGNGVTIVGAGTLLDDTRFDTAYLLSIGCPIVLYNATTMGAARTAFEKMSGGVAQINPDGNLLALLFAMGVAAAIVGPSNCVFVDVNGNDDTGARGDAAKPFETIAAALLAMLDGDQMRIGPGEFPGVGLIPSLTLQNASILGSGRRVTTIAATGGHCWELGAIARESWMFADMKITTDNGDYAIAADGTTAPAGDYFPDGLVIENVTLGTAAQSSGFLARYCGKVSLRNVEAPGSCQFDIEDNGVVEFFALSADSPAIFIDSDVDDPLTPDASILPARFDGACDIRGGTINLVKQGGILGAKGMRCGTLRGLNMVKGNANQLSTVNFFGLCTTLDFGGGNNRIPDCAAQIDFNVAGSTVLGNATVECDGVVNPPQIVRMDCSIGGVLIIGDNVYGQCRGCTFKNPIVAAILGDSALRTTGTGVVVAPPFPMPPIAAASPTVFTFPFTLSGTKYTVCTDADDATCLPLATTPRTATGFEVVVTVAAGNVRALVGQYSA